MWWDGMEGLPSGLMKVTISNASLRTRLALLVLLVLLPAFALVWYGNLEQQRLEQKRIEEKVVSDARLAATTQQHFIDDARQLLTTLTQFPFLVLATDKHVAETHFANLKLLQPNYADFGLIETNGLLFCDGLRTNSGVNFQDDPAFVEVMRTGSFAMGTVAHDPVTDARVVRFGCPVLDGDGRFMRVVFASFPVDLFSAALRQIPLEDDGTARVLDQRGNVVATLPGDGASIGASLSSAAFFRSAVKLREGLFNASLPERGPQIGGVSFATDGHHHDFLVTVLVPRQLIEMASGRNELGQMAGAFDHMADVLIRREDQLKAAGDEIRQVNEGLEQRIRERTSQLEEINRELEAFSYSVSHDLRAPLRHVQGYASMLERELGDQLSEKARRFLKTITSAGSQMGNLIDELLAYSRIGRAEMQSRCVSLDELARDTINSQEFLVDGRTIHWTINPLPVVLGDPMALRQVMANLVGNAVKYTSRRETAEIEIGSERDNDGMVVIFVRDNGAGFDMQYADKLFGVFQRLHRADEFDGTGIGLATVRRVIARHGGRTWAEGVVDQGATFYFTLVPAPVDGQQTEK